MTKPITGTAVLMLQDEGKLNVADPVFPLADRDYVRTRLTHSLEIASVGRSLGARVGAAICTRHSLSASSSLHQPLSPQ